MNHEQKDALRRLSRALTEATETGLFDELAGDILHPDTINAFCDGISEAVGERQGDSPDGPRDGEGAWSHRPPGHTRRPRVAPP